MIFDQYLEKHLQLKIIQKKWRQLLYMGKIYTNTKVKYINNIRTSQLKGEL